MANFEIDLSIPAIATYRLDQTPLRFEYANRIKNCDCWHLRPFFKFPQTVLPIAAMGQYRDDAVRFDRLTIVDELAFEELDCG